MTPEERAREALLRCIDKPRYLEAYQPEIARAIREAVEAERESCAKIADDEIARWTPAHPREDNSTTIQSRLEAEAIAKTIRARGESA